MILRNARTARILRLGRKFSRQARFALGPLVLVHIGPRACVRTPTFSTSARSITRHEGAELKRKPIYPGFDTTAAFQVLGKGCRNACGDDKLKTLGGTARNPARLLFVHDVAGTSWCTSPVRWRQCVPLSKLARRAARCALAIIQHNVHLASMLLPAARVTAAKWNRSVFLTFRAGVAVRGACLAAAGLQYAARDCNPR